MNLAEQPVYFAVVCFVPVCFVAVCLVAVNFETACLGAVYFAVVCFVPVCFVAACLVAVNFETACLVAARFELAELLVYSEPAELFEALFALPTRGAKVAVAPEAACFRRNLQAVVNMAAPQVSGCSAPDEPVPPEEVPPEEVLDEAALFLLSEKVRSYGEVSDLLLEAVR
jgi:hypothetical protein